MIRFDDDGTLAALSVEFASAGRRMTKTLTGVYSEATDDLVAEWKSNARASSGEHGKHYPDSIDSQRLLSAGIAFEAGPNPTKRQGKMAFETGSVNSPPHPDGQRATDTVVPKLERRIAIALTALGL